MSLFVGGHALVQRSLANTSSLYLVHTADRDKTGTPCLKVVLSVSAV